MVSCQLLLLTQALTQGWCHPHTDESSSSAKHLHRTRLLGEPKSSPVSNEEQLSQGTDVTTPLSCCHLWLFCANSPTCDKVVESV